MMWSTILGEIFMLAGVLLLLTGASGAFAMHDVSARFKIVPRCTSFGAFLTIIGVGIREPSWIFKTTLIAFFLLFTNPFIIKATGNIILRMKEKEAQNTESEYEEGEGE